MADAPKANPFAGGGPRPTHRGEHVDAPASKGGHEGGVGVFGRVCDTVTVQDGDGAGASSWRQSAPAPAPAPTVTSASVGPAPSTSGNAAAAAATAGSTAAIRVET